MSQNLLEDPPVVADMAVDGELRSSAKKQKSLRSHRWTPLVLALPAMVLFALFFLWPAGLGLYYSFTNYKGVGTPDVVGVANYRRLFGDGQFYSSLGRTFLYAVIVVPTGYCVSLFLAWLLTSTDAVGKSVARVIFFVPWLVSSIVTGVIFRWLFGENFGLFNFLMGKLGLGPVMWQTNSTAALFLIIIAGTWAGTAFSMLLFISAIRNIPRSYIEAAELDGASPWRKFRSVTWPLLRPTSFMVILLGTIGAMKEFALIQALNGGGPGTKNVLIVQYIYRTGFERGQIGYASAASIVLMVILMIIAIIQMRFDTKSSLE